MQIYQLPLWKEPQLSKQNWNLLEILRDISHGHPQAYHLKTQAVTKNMKTYCVVFLLHGSSQHSKAQEIQMWLSKKPKNKILSNKLKDEVGSAESALSLTKQLENCTQRSRWWQIKKRIRESIKYIQSKTYIRILRTFKREI